MKKFELTNEFVTNASGTKLFRIKSLIQFGNVEKGELGGYIEKEYNLSQNGGAWVFGNARVSGDARVSGGAWVFSNARVSGNACVSGNAYVSGDARVSGDAWVSGNACVSGNAYVSGNARVFSNACVSGDACVSGNARVFSNARVSGDACVSGNARVSGNANIFSTNHVFVVGPIGSRNDFTTFFRDKDGEITVKCGCFLGKIDKFLEEVKQKHGDNKHAQAYKKAVEAARLQIDLTKEGGN